MNKCFVAAIVFLFAKPCFCQELQYDEGVFVEKIITKDTSIHRYSIDNIIYKPDRIFLYDYYFKDKNGAIRKIIGDKNSDIENQLYETVDTGFQDVNIIDKIRMTVTDDLKFFLRTDSDYTQTVIKYEYCNKNGNSIASEETGLIENTKNVWVHPPRSFYFKILEINPFPFVRMDSVETWNWPLQVGEFSSNSKWKQWKGRLDMEMAYKKLANEILKTNFGMLVCEVVSATASSRIGKSWLKSYFNSKYGFVKLEYTNIDGTKLIMNLIDLSPLLQ